METLIISIVVFWFFLGFVGNIKSVKEKAETNKNIPRVNNNPRTYSENKRNQYDYKKDYVKSLPKSSQSRESMYISQNDNAIITKKSQGEVIDTESTLDLDINMDTLKDGILLSQILEQPRSKNPHRLYSYRR